MVYLADGQTQDLRVSSLALESRQSRSLHSGGAENLKPYKHAIIPALLVIQNEEERRCIKVGKED